MQIGVVVDASCDLPRAYVEANDIHVLPNELSFGDKRFVDERDPEATMKLFRRQIRDKSVPAASGACGVERIRDLLLEEVVTRYDRVLVISPSAARSRVFEHATEASYAILQSYRERREHAGQSGTFALRILDSGTLCAGHAALACRAVKLAEEDIPFEKLRTMLALEAGRVRTLVVPNDLYYVRDRGPGAPGDTLGGATYALGRMTRSRPVLSLEPAAMRVAGRGRGFEGAATVALERAREALRAGLGAPVMMLSFGGDPRVIRDLPAYQDLEAQAATQRVDLHLAVMSATMGVRLGPGALSVGWIEAER